MREAHSDVKKTNLDVRAADAERDGTDLAEAANVFGQAVDVIAQMSQMMERQRQIIIDHNQQLLEIVVAPKELVRDERGRPAGVRTRLN